MIAIAHQQHVLSHQALVAAKRANGGVQGNPLTMPINELQQIRIGVVSDSVQQRAYLKQALHDNGLLVKICEPLSRLLLKKIAQTQLDVLLLDLSDESEQAHSLLDELLDTPDLPIIFNDVSGLMFNEARVLEKWFGKLLQKIVVLTGRDASGEAPVDRNYDSLIAELPAAFVDKQAEMARNVWVLGASLGGPEMVKRFLAAITADLPVAFVLAQHLGANFVALLAKQLDQITPFNVMVAKQGHVLRHGQVVVAPVFERLLINPIGAIDLQPLVEELPYSPSVDQVISDVASRYREKSGAIIFSGMGDDGRLGCKQLAEMGGQVWVQDADSCIISAMPDAVAGTGVSSYQGTPEALAKNLKNKLYTEAIEEVC